MTAVVVAKAPIVAILNPNSGPGHSANSDYASAIARFRAVGGTILGYVPSMIFVGGAWRDDVIVERLWRSVQYDEVCVCAYGAISESRSLIGYYPGH